MNIEVDLGYPPPVLRYLLRQSPDRSISLSGSDLSVLRINKHLAGSPLLLDWTAKLKGAADRFARISLLADGSMEVTADADE